MISGGYSLFAMKYDRKRKNALGARRFLPAQYDWNLQPSSFASPQNDPLCYSSGWVHTLHQSTTSPVCETDDYALLFDLDFLLSSEMALLSPIEGYQDLSTLNTQLSPFDSRYLLSDIYMAYR